MKNRVFLLFFLNMFVGCFCAENQKKNFYEETIKYVDLFTKNCKKFLTEYESLPEEERETLTIQKEFLGQYSWPLMKNVFDIYDKLDLVDFLFSTDRYSYGEKIKQFEKEWGQWLGVKHSVFVNSGSSANLILVASIKELYGIKDQSKVLVPACTWSTNISPLIQCNLQPIFCDINLKNFSFDEKHLEKIKKEHPDINLIFITHLLGLPSDMDLLKRFYPEAILMEDCCEAHGATYKGQKVGTLSKGSTFSFFFGHHLTTIEGGFVSTDDDELYKLLCLKRSHGLARELPLEDFEHYSQKHADINKKFLFLTDGYNVRSTEINAVLGIRQLKKMDSFIIKRKNNFSYFIDIIKSYEKYFFIPSDDGNSSFCLPIVAKNKELFKLLVNELEKKGIETRPIVGSNLVRQPFLEKYNLNFKDFENADMLHFMGIYISNNQFLNKDNFSLLEKALSFSVAAYISQKDFFGY